MDQVPQKISGLRSGSRAQGEQLREDVRDEERHGKEGWSDTLLNANHQYSYEGEQQDGECKDVAVTALGRLWRMHLFFYEGG